MTEFDFLGKYQLSHTDAHTSCTEMISKCFLFFYQTFAPQSPSKPGRLTMMVAVAVEYSPPPQHSPMLGHLASSHT